MKFKVIQVYADKEEHEMIKQLKGTSKRGDSTLIRDLIRAEHARRCKND